MQPNKHHPGTWYTASVVNAISLDVLCAKSKVNMLYHILARIVMVACVVMAFLLLTPAPTAAQVQVSGNGSISGQLLDGSRHNAPLPKQTVTLQMAQGPNAGDLTTSITDEHGIFTFTNLATDKTINYAVYIRYQGTQYVSDAIALDSNPVQHVNLTVYEATSSTAQVAITQVSILIHQPDAQKGTFSVSEVYAFKNLDTHAYVGSLDASKGKPNALLFSLPSGAKNITLSKGFDGYKVISVDSGFATDAALPPGNSEFAFVFDVPYNAATYNFRYLALYPTVALSFMIPPAINAHSPSLSVQGVITADDQQTYRLFSANLLRANQEVSLNLEGLPNVIPASAPSPLNAGSIWLIVAVLLMLATVGVTWFLWRAQRRLSAKKRPQPARKTAAKFISSGPPSMARSSDRREALLQELLELDKAFEARRISKATYQERRAKTKVRLRALISEEEAATR